MADEQAIQPQETERDQATVTPPEAPASGSEPTPAEAGRDYEAELRKLQRKLREAESKLRDYEAKSLTEVERLRQRVAEYERLEAEWQRERQELLVRSAVEAAARKLGFADPAIAWRLVDLAEIETDDDGQPKNAEAVVRKLAQRWPFLLGGGVSPANPARQPATFTRSQLRDPEFFRKHREAILQALREGRIVQE